MVYGTKANTDHIGMDSLDDAKRVLAAHPVGSGLLVWSLPTPERCVVGVADRMDLVYATTSKRTVITVLTVLTELTVLTVSPKISPYLIFSSFRIVANFGSFRESLPKAVRVFRLTEDLAAIRRYLIPNLGKIPQSLEIGFR